MASQEIIYSSSNDDGERVSTSVAPINDSELVKAAITNRPTECLRSRTEVVRDALIDHNYLADTDIRWIMTYGDDITGENIGNDLPLILWDPVTGTFTVDTVLLFQPIKTPAIDTVTDLDGESFVYTFVTDTLTISSFFRNYAGGNRREVRWVWTPMVGATAVLSGTPAHILTISVDSGGSTQVIDVEGALAGLGASLGLAGFSRVLTGGLDLIVAPPADHVFSKIHEREMHRVAASQFNAFFGSNSLAEGDTLAIFYEYMVEPGGTGGRRQSCPKNSNIAISAGQLFITSQEPEKIPLAIPICKRLGDDLIFLDGTICYGGMTPTMSQVYAGEHGYTVDRIINAPTTIPITMSSMWYGAMAVPTWGTIMAALDGIVADLASSVATSGAERVGFKTAVIPHVSLGWYNVPAAPPPGGDSVYNVVAAILDLVNDKASLNLGAAGAEETITGRWLFNNHVKIGVDKAILRALASDTNYHLVYRNGGSTESDATVDWSTYSIYERTHASTDVEYIEVLGGYLNAAGTTVTAPSAGSGPIWIHSSVGDFTCFRIIVTAAVVLTIATASHWDYHEKLTFPAPGGDLQCHKLVTGNDYVAGVSFHTFREWAIDQQVKADIDYVDGFARIQVSSQPYSRVLEGAFAQPEDINDTTIWTANTIKVSPGRVLVNGVPVIIDTPGLTLNDLTSRLMAGVTVPVNEAAMAFPLWYYLWMRSDGNVRVGSHAPVSDWVAGTPGDTLYRPALSEVEAPYTQKDYTLLDVMSLMFIGLGPTYFFDCAVPVGGGERRLLYRMNPVVPGTHVQYVIDEMLDDVRAPLARYMSTKDIGANTSKRCPGIPTGVSCKAALAYWIALNVPANGEYRSVAIGLNGGGVTVVQNGLYPASDYADTPDIYFYRKAFSLITEVDPIHIEDRGRLDIVTRPSNSYWSEVAGTGGSGVGIMFKLNLLGFYWDRGAGSQRIE
jgi:hypothetical protein